MPSIVPAYLLYSIWTYAEYVAGYDQQDAHEFLIALIDGLDTHLRMYHPVRSNGQNHSSPRRDIGNVFYYTVLLYLYLSFLHNN